MLLLVNVALSEAAWFPQQRVVSTKDVRAPRWGGEGAAFSGSAAVPRTGLAAATPQHNVPIVFVESKSLSFCSPLPFPINLQSEFDIWEVDGA